eukprot:scaffold269377_cov33-Tisochrysis_lutea.AAC.4
MQILLNAISSDVLEIPLGHISPDALADGELWPLHNLAEIFAELCDILLKRDDTPAQPQSVEADGSPPHSARPSSQAGRRPQSARSAAQSDSCVCGLEDGSHEPCLGSAAAVDIESLETARRAAGSQALPRAAVDSAGAAAETFRVACSEALAAEALRAPGIAGARRRRNASTGSAPLAGTSGKRPKKPLTGGRASNGPASGQRAKSAPPRSRGRTLHRGPSPGVVQHQMAEGIERRTRTSRQTSGRPRTSGSASAANFRADIAGGKQRRARSKRASGKDTGATTSARLESEIAELQAALEAEAAARANDVEAAAAAAAGATAAAARVAAAAQSELGYSAAAQYAGLVRQQLAGVRRAERFELIRGRAADHNARTEARIAAARRARVTEEVARCRRSRLEKAAAKGDLTYRRLYKQAIESERQRMLLERCASPRCRLR